MGSSSLQELAILFGQMDRTNQNIVLGSPLSRVPERMLTIVETGRLAHTVTVSIANPVATG